jgi:hypothetical protein
MPSSAVNEDLPKYMLNSSAYIVQRLRDYRFHCVKKRCQVGRVSQDTSCALDIHVTQRPSYRQMRDEHK